MLIFINFLCSIFNNLVKAFIIIKCLNCTITIILKIFKAFSFVFSIIALYLLSIFKFILRYRILS